MALAGRIALALALAVACYGIGASLYGARRGRRDWVDSGRRAVYALAAILTRRDGDPRGRLHSQRLRLQHGRRTTSSTTTPLLYRAAALWSSQEGSLLLWVWLLSIWSSVAIFITRNRLRDVVPYATSVLLGFGAFFTTLLVFLDSPFAQTQPGARRRGGARSAAAQPEHADPSADALLGLHVLHDPVRVRGRRADRAPRRRRLDPRDPPLRARLVAVPRHRRPARRALVLLRARLGRLLGLGSRSRTRR